jgi:hypothetical protein
MGIGLVTATALPVFEENVSFIDEDDGRPSGCKTEELLQSVSNAPSSFLSSPILIFVSALFETSADDSKQFGQSTISEYNIDVHKAIRKLTGTQGESGPIHRCAEKWEKWALLGSNHKCGRFLNDRQPWEQHE